MGRLVFFLLSLALAVISLPIRLLRGRKAFNIRSKNGTMTEMSVDFLKTFFDTFC